MSVSRPVASRLLGRSRQRLSLVEDNPSDSWMTAIMSTSTTSLGRRSNDGDDDDDDDDDAATAADRCDVWLLVCW